MRDAAPFPWDSYVASLVHPTKVAILNNLWTTGEAMSSAQMQKKLGGKFSLSAVNYHMKWLADRGLIVQIWQRPSGGSVEIGFGLDVDYQAPFQTPGNER